MKYYKKVSKELYDIWYKIMKESKGLKRKTIYDYFLDTYGVELL